MIPGIDYPAISIVFFCHDGCGNYLFSKRSVKCRDEHGCYDPGGGLLELHETVDQLLHRELQEEYNLEPLKYEFLGMREMHRANEGKKTHWIALDFKVLVDPSKVKNNEPHKFDELVWHRMNNLPNPMHSQFSVALEKYKDRF
ncbi:NUDIX domain-containing protein [Patescibacteria group bacterium]|nr:NUDIX domain-containing protein [Patescibacteria group bacterium]